MKICPNCRKNYTDESLNFCLEDGGVLKSLADDAPAATMFMPQARPTNPNENLSNPTVPAPNWGTAQTRFAPPPASKKKSKAWMWILGILGGGALLVIFGMVGFVGLIASIDEPKNPPPDDSDAPRNNNTAPKNDSTVVKSDDFANWKFNNPAVGRTEYRNGEFTMISRAPEYYFVLLANKDFLTSGFTTRVTVKNTTGAPTKSGFGLIVGSDPQSPLVQDYAFLIDTVNQSYRVAMHKDKKETQLVGWTRFPAIRTGTQTNELQVRDETGRMTFFINGQMATTVRDSTGFKNGIAGIYSSDAVPIAFSDLEIRK